MDTSGFLSDGAQYDTRQAVIPVGGARWRGPVLNTDGSSLPIHASIAAIRDENGNDAMSKFNYEVEVSLWDSVFTGGEQSLDEINRKRRIVARPVLDINPLNGQLIFYTEADTARTPLGRYTVDILVKNSSREIRIDSALVLTLQASSGVSLQQSPYRLGFTSAAYVVRRTGDGNRITFRYFNNETPLRVSDMIFYPINNLGYVSNSFLDIPQYMAENFAFSADGTSATIDVNSFPFPLTGSRHILHYAGGVGGTSPIGGTSSYFGYLFAFYKAGSYEIDINLTSP
ncbi:DUF5007 domain-containing protein [Sphingobacterium bambusae]|uniref:DUF5007 domain-containing protein n=2 Tax=Sphingobacterium bambusae TaxID=662858 RepID=A0ABW6BIT7_9SPHI